MLKVPFSVATNHFEVFTVNKERPAIDVKSASARGYFTVHKYLYLGSLDVWRLKVHNWLPLPPYQFSDKTSTIQRTVILRRYAKIHRYTRHAQKDYFEDRAQSPGWRALPTLSRGKICYVSHASTHARRDLFERHRTSDLNRITRAHYYAAKRYILSVHSTVVARRHKRLVGFVLCNRVVTPPSRNVIFIKFESKATARNTKTSHTKITYNPLRSISHCLLSHC